MDTSRHALTIVRRGASLTRRRRRRASLSQHRSAAELPKFQVHLYITDEGGGAIVHSFTLFKFSL